MISAKDARLHPAYQDSLVTAIRRATDTLVADRACFSVYFDGKAIFVRASEAAKPADSVIICIAQRWDADTVQLRFAGAESKFVKV